MQQTVEPKFKIGDTVSLKSGKESPEMTIKSLVMEMNYHNAEYDLFYGDVVCNWFLQDNLKEATFHQDMLKLIEQ